MSPSLLAMLWRHGQQREVDTMRDQVRLMRHAMREGVADVLVPMLTGKPRRHGADEGDRPAGLAGGDLQMAVDMLGVRLGAAPNHPGLVMTGPPGHPYGKPS